jgi:hypothetical protein
VNPLQIKRWKRSHMAPPWDAIRKRRVVVAAPLCGTKSAAGPGGLWAVGFTPRRIGKGKFLRLMMAARMSRSMHFIPSGKQSPGRANLKIRRSVGRARGVRARPYRRPRGRTRHAAIRRRLPSNAAIRSRPTARPATLQTRLNEIVGRHGIGRLDLVENCFVGMKSRGVYETLVGADPAGRSSRHRGLTPNRGVAHLKDELVPRFAGLIYNGLWFSPASPSAFAQDPLQPRPRHLRGGRGLRPARRRELHPAQRALRAPRRAAGSGLIQPSPAVDSSPKRDNNSPVSHAG